MPLRPRLSGRWKLGQKDAPGASAQLPRQDYEALQARCLRDGCLFEDSSFPATLSSIGSGPLLRALPPGLQWRRPPVRGREGLWTTRTGGNPTFLPGLRALGYPALRSLIPMRGELAKFPHNHCPGKTRGDPERGLRCSCPSGQNYEEQLQPKV